VRCLDQALAPRREEQRGSPCDRPEIVTPLKGIAGEQQSLPLRLGAPCTTLLRDTQ
jgi:hypothetical protein